MTPPTKPRRYKWRNCPFCGTNPCRGHAVAERPITKPRRAKRSTQTVGEYAAERMASPSRRAVAERVYRAVIHDACGQPDCCKVLRSLRRETILRTIERALGDGDALADSLRHEAEQMRVKKDCGCYQRLLRRADEIDEKRPARRGGKR